MKKGAISKKIKAQRKLLASIEDWRGCIAVLTIVCGSVVCVLQPQSIPGMIPLMAFVVKWYFDAKSDGQ